MVKKDCFGFEGRCGVKRKDRCTALNKLYCEYEDCKFYKAKERYEQETKKEKI